MAILSAVFWASGWHALKHRWQTLKVIITIILAVLVIMLLFINWGLELWRNMDNFTLLLSTNGNRTFFPY